MNQEVKAPVFAHVELDRYNQLIEFERALLQSQSGVETIILSHYRGYDIVNPTVATREIVNRVKNLESQVQDLEKELKEYRDKMWKVVNVRLPRFGRGRKMIDIVVKETGITNF